MQGKSVEHACFFSAMLQVHWQLEASVPCSKVDASYHRGFNNRLIHCVIGSYWTGNLLDCLMVYGQE